MGVKISELQEKTTISDDDVIAVVDATAGTKKMKMSLVQKSNNFACVTDTTHQKDYTLTAWETKTLELNTLKNSHGSLLTSSNNGIKIGAGVSYVEICGIVKFANTPVANIYLQVFKGDTQIISIDLDKTTTYNSASVIIPNLIIDVTEGDILTIKFLSGTPGQYRIIQDFPNTFLQAKVMS